MHGGRLRERFAFDEPVETVGAGGVVSTVWTERLITAAQLIYTRGNETIEAARLEGRAVYKLKIRSFTSSRGITADWRARDTRRGDTEYAITEVDAITDRRWVYIVIESGKAT